jgi:glycerol-3-phosphate dehydrogenase (NAD(P)+)
MTPPIPTIAVVGAGAWGTALACLLSRRWPRVILWARRPEVARELRETRVNAAYLPDVELPAEIEFVSDPATVASADVILFVPPSKAFREVCRFFAPVGLRQQSILVSCTKGMEFGSGLRMSQILQEHFPQNPVAVLSGPAHAEEIARGGPAAVVIGAANRNAAIKAQAWFDIPGFRAYRNEDVVGIELGGALKNIYAIAAGVGDGLKLGDNAKAALVTRALAEMIRLGTLLGGGAETFQGLSGIGDLMVTCFSRHSRNRYLGEQLGLGRGVQDVLDGMKAVAEGYYATRSFYQVARQRNARTPILDEMHALLYGRSNAKRAVQALMERDLRHEWDESQGSNERGFGADL